MSRRRTWPQAEVSRLLSLVEGSGKAALLMASTSRPNEALWREISHGLAEAGYERSVSQCRAKWKTLKHAFHSEREKRRRVGHHSSRLPQHYRAMKRIWNAAGRPVFGERRMLVNLPSRKRRPALATRSSSSLEPPEHDVLRDAPGMLLSPLLPCTKNEPESPARGEYVAGVPLTPPTMPHTSRCFPRVSLLGCHTDLKQEETEEKAGPGVAGSLQNVQQLLVQILQTSRQQQALLERLARDTVSHLQLLSHSLVQAWFFRQIYPGLHLV